MTNPLEGDFGCIFLETVQREGVTVADVGAPAFEWTQEIEDRILDQFMEGKSFRDFLGPTREEGLPGISTFFKHLRDCDEFAKRYARAREFQADMEFEEIREIADNGSNDWMEVNDPDNPGYRLNGEHVQRSRLRIDARKWRAAKMANGKYGDKLELAGDKDSPVSIVVKRYAEDGNPKEPI